MLNVIIVLMVLSLIVVAVFDDLTATIPHTITIVLLILGILSCIFDKTTDYALTITLSVVIFAIMLTMFFFLKEGSIGGGDVKIITITFLFLHSFNVVMQYCILFLFWNVFAYFFTKIILKEKKCRLGRYLSLSLLGAIMPNIMSIILVSLSFLVLIEFIDSLFKRGGNYYEKNFKIF